MKRIGLFVLIVILVGMTTTACKKNRPAVKIEGTYSGHFQGNYQGNDTIVNSGYEVRIESLDKNNAQVIGSMFETFKVLVTPNGLNVELVSPTAGLSQFLYEGEEERLTFQFEAGGNTAIYNGVKN